MLEGLLAGYGMVEMALILAAILGAVGFAVTRDPRKALIIGIVGAVIGAGIAGIRDEGKASVEMGYIDEEGNKHYLEEGDTLYFAPSDDKSEISEYFGELKLKVVTEKGGDAVSGESVDISGDYKIDLKTEFGGLRGYRRLDSGSLSKTISSGSKVKVHTATVGYSTIQDKLDQKTTLKFEYDITASWGDISKTTTVSGKMTVEKEEEDTLTIEYEGVDTGSMRLVKE